LKTASFGETFNIEHPWAVHYTEFCATKTTQQNSGSGVSFLDEDTIRSLIENHNLTLSQFLRQTAFDEDWEEEDGEDDIEIDPCFQNLSPTLARRMQMTMDTLVSAIALVSVEEEMDNTASGSVSRFDSDHSNDDTTDAHEYTDEPFIKQ
jgi:hypothetical protein